jgi:putative membrane protein
MVLNSLSGLPAFAAYFAGAVILCIGYLFAYTKITTHDEFGLIAKGNASAAVALGMSLFGFALPLASAIYHSDGILDCLIWGVIALATQLGAYYLAGLAQDNLSARIANNELAAAFWLGFVSLSAGILNAASMSY